MPSLVEVQEELKVTDKLLEEAYKVIEEIPECPFHGPHCLPYAKEWIRRVRTLGEIILRK